MDFTFQDVWEVGHQLHLEYQVVRDPGFVLEPHHWEERLLHVLEHRNVFHFVDQNIKLEPRLHVCWDSGQRLHPEDSGVQGGVGRQPRCNVLEVGRISLVEVRLRDEDRSSKPALGGVVDS